MRHIGVRFYIMHDELQDIQETYNTTHHGFEELCTNLDGLSPELRLVQLKKGSTFLHLSMVSIKRHFKRYLSSLLFFSAATKPKDIIIICQYLLGEISDQTEIYESLVHQKKIDCTKFIQFLETNASKEQAVQHPLIQQNLPAIRMIASLKRSIWDDNPHPVLIIFRDDFLQHYASFWSNGHQIERDVKEVGYCDNTKRSE